LAPEKRLFLHEAQVASPSSFAGVFLPIFLIHYRQLGIHQQKELYSMIFVKTFKGYEDKIFDLDTAVNQWISNAKADVVDIKTAMAHEIDGRAGSGDLIYTVLYKADAPRD